MATDTTITVARPYAKAAFEIALEREKLASWSQLLKILAQVSLDTEVQSVIQRPGTKPEDIASFFIDIAGSYADQEGQNFIKILAENNRLLALPDILAAYEHLRAEQEKSLTVSVVTFSELSESQKKSIAESLKKRLKREIELQESVDESLLGGAIIRAGDMVIDGSVRGKLEKLKNEITA